MAEKALKINTMTGDYEQTADLVESSEVSATPAADAIVKADGSGQIDAGWLTSVLVFEELDGLPSVTPEKIIVPNNSLIDNGDGTVTLDMTSSGLSDPTTTEGDLLVRGASQIERLAAGAAGSALGISAGSPVWQTLLNLASGVSVNDEQVVGARKNALTAPVAAPTDTAATQTSPWGYATQAQADDLIAAVRNLVTRVDELEDRLKESTGHGLIYAPASDLSTLGSCQLWLRKGVGMFADSVGGTPATNGNPVKAWEDQSSAGNHFTEPTNPPVLGANGELVYGSTGVGLANNNKSSWTFLHNGSSFTVFMRFTVGTTSDPNTIYAMLGNSGWTTANTGAVFGYDDRSVYSWYDRVACAVTKSVPGNTVINIGTNNTLTANVVHVVAFTFDSASLVYTIKVDNITVATGSQASAPTTALATYDLELGGWGGSYRFVGSIEEIIMYDELLDSTDQDAVYQNFSSL
jgi:hypothetical protein